MFLHPWSPGLHPVRTPGGVTFGRRGLPDHPQSSLRSSRSAYHVLDCVGGYRFLSPFRTFYIGLGTIASYLIIYAGL